MRSCSEQNIQQKSLLIRWLLDLRRFACLFCSSWRCYFCAQLHLVCSLPYGGACFLGTMATCWKQVSEDSPYPLCLGYFRWCSSCLSSPPGSDLVCISRVLPLGYSGLHKEKEKRKKKGIKKGLLKQCFCRRQNVNLNRAWKVEMEVNDDSF